MERLGRVSVQEIGLDDVKIPQVIIRRTSVDFHQNRGVRGSGSEREALDPASSGQVCRSTGSPPEI